MVYANRRLLVVLSAFMTLHVAGCTPGYTSAADLDQAKLGPQHCAKSCYDLGMRMTALVLVQSAAAGCVCEPIQLPPPAAPMPPPAGPPQPPQPHSSLGGAGVAAGYVVVLAQQAAARRANRYQYRTPPPMRR